MEEKKKRRRRGKPVTVKDIFFRYPDGSLVNIKDMTPERRQAEFDAMQDAAMAAIGYIRQDKLEAVQAAGAAAPAAAAAPH